MIVKSLVPGLAVLLAGAALASEPQKQCASEPDDYLRLACYDSVYRHLPTRAEVVDEPGLVVSDPENSSSAMSSAWELGPNDKRRPFVVRTYLPNFLLPVHYTSSLNRSPGSSAHPASPANAGYRPIEAKLQISLRAKVAENLLLPGADLWVAYTQRSLWQLWNSGDSSPFRSTDYQPEAIYVVPVPESLGKLPFGWNLRMFQAGFTHQSNGQSDPLSRSWNRASLGAGLEKDDFSLLFGVSQRLHLQGKDDNPHIDDYMGRGEVSMAWSPGPSSLSLTWRSNLKSVNRGSLQVDWSHPVFSGQPNGLRWYVQLFSGYGEMLLDYNHRQNSVGLGLSLFQF